jgi:uncharacterized protein DUF3108
MKGRVAIVAVLFAAQLRAANMDAVYNAGETLDYDLSWSRVSGGAARMTISPIVPERWRITSVAQSGTFFSHFFKVHDEVESIVAARDFSTIEYHKVLLEGSKHKDELTVVDSAKNVAYRKGQAVPVTRPVFDPLSMWYYLRDLDLTPGKTFEFTIIADGKVYTVTATVGAGETITTPAGTFKTVVVEPKMAAQAGVFRDEQARLLIWYSDDARHIPVRIRSDVKIGSITVTLKAMKTGVDSIEPTPRPDQ